MSPTPGSRRWLAESTPDCPTRRAGSIGPRWQAATSPVTTTVYDQGLIVVSEPPRLTSDPLPDGPVAQMEARHAGPIVTAPGALPRAGADAARVARGRGSGPARRQAGLHPGPGPRPHDGRPERLHRGRGLHRRRRVPMDAHFRSDALRRHDRATSAATAGRWPDWSSTRTGFSTRPGGKAAGRGERSVRSSPARFRATARELCPGDERRRTRDSGRGLLRHQPGQPVRLLHGVPMGGVHRVRAAADPDRGLHAGPCRLGGRPRRGRHRRRPHGPVAGRQVGGRKARVHPGTGR